MTFGTGFTWSRAHVLREERRFALRSGAGDGDLRFGSAAFWCARSAAVPNVQYGRTDYVCAGFHNGSTCSNGMRFRIEDVEREVLRALELDLLSPKSLHRAADLAMEYFDKQQRAEAPTAPALSAAIADINAREADVREQFKAGKLPPTVFKTWLAELARERATLHHPATTKSARVSQSDFLHEYKLTLARQLKVFTSRENVAMSREALRNVLVDGTVVLKPDVANARFEGALSVPATRNYLRKIR